MSTTRPTLRQMLTGAAERAAQKRRERKAAEGRVPLSTRGVGRVPAHLRGLEVKPVLRVDSTEMMGAMATFTEDGPRMVRANRARRRAAGNTAGRQRAQASKARRRNVA